MVSVNIEQARTLKAGRPQAGRTANVVLLVQCKTCRKSNSKRIRSFGWCRCQTKSNLEFHFAYAKADPNHNMNESR